MQQSIESGMELQNLRRSEMGKRTKGSATGARKKNRNKLARSKVGRKRGKEEEAKQTDEDVCAIQY